MTLCVVTLMATSGENVMTLCVVTLLATIDDIMTLSVTTLLLWLVCMGMS